MSTAVILSTLEGTQQIYRGTTPGEQQNPISAL